MLLLVLGLWFMISCDDLHPEGTIPVACMAAADMNILLMHCRRTWM